MLKKIYNFALDTMQTVLLAASIFLVVYIFLFRPFQVSGESMFSTFKDREFIITNLIELRFKDLERGDVIVFHAPTDPDKDFIKRVMGKPGDTLSINEGSVYLNNQKLNEPYLRSGIKTYAGSFLKENSPVIVPPNKYFVMGDNRPFSSDSREWGFLSKEKLIGKSLFVYFPVKAMRIVKNPFK